MAQLVGRHPVKVKVAGSSPALAAYKEYFKKEGDCYEERVLLFTDL